MADTKDPLPECTGFDWDEGNAEKNRELHHGTPEEAEDIFFNEPLIVRSDIRHSTRERRFYALGLTSRGGGPIRRFYDPLKTHSGHLDSEYESKGPGNIGKIRKLRLAPKYSGVPLGR